MQPPSNHRSPASSLISFVCGRQPSWMRFCHFAHAHAHFARRVMAAAAGRARACAHESRRRRASRSALEGRRQGFHRALAPPRVERATGATFMASTSPWPVGGRLRRVDSGLPLPATPSPQTHAALAELERLAPLSLDEARRHRFLGMSRPSAIACHTMSYTRRVV